MYFTSVDSSTGQLTQLRMLPTQVRHMRVGLASSDDTQWLKDTLRRESRQHGVQVESTQGAELTVSWLRDSAEYG
jgi:poly-gamma-glutamate synthesis protein (capsule biosynthesis protein)